MRVLVADDNVDGAETMAAVLEISGYEVVIAHDGAAALSLAETFRPRMAIIDIGMPTLDGYEVARSLRTRPWANGVFLVAVTGWGQESDRTRALCAGFDDHLVKPVEVDSLLALLARKAVSADV
jgi:DNA-binding response OmpR family regulator